MTRRITIGYILQSLSVIMFTVAIN